MSSDEARLIEARHLRDAARGVVRTDVATLKLALAQRPLGIRIKERATAAATDAAAEGMALAKENPAVVALTGTTLVAWLFRKPLVRLVCAAFARAKQALAPRPKRWRLFG